MIKDSFNRVHNYLRISLTDNCNLRCFYCMPEEDYEFTKASRLMQADEIESLAKIFVNEGVTKIRLTGGEPLVRKDAGQIILALSRLNIDLSFTTNGARIHEFLDLILEANITSINVSLDTLDADKFHLITRRDIFAQVMANIRLLLENNIQVKLNVVVMKELNDMEIVDFVEWTKDYPIEVRFIEFMPFAGNRWTSNKVVSMEEILQQVDSKYTYYPLAAGPNDTAKHYKVAGHSGSFAIISTMTSPFCGTCNRMRLTADGKLKNCLFSESETDLLGPMRNGEPVLPLIHECIGNKAKALGGQFSGLLQDIEANTIHNRSMITIGG
ncbi:GTP 3',8-cyclase MoaA [Pedobacter sp. MR2016-24]|uniref:GTP 3',8-cyclase MoaA n=1 Tax=Pedobacter sp. MR2016-24 TaxID=2994466 RepID=UPI002246D92F|nr:GTP 3',8-cyclase MoaA [Pedobacter sp. MR2016-24]MCX2485212.1 GTP 3',8-cyclase MoaA [Pedobacter sp. MR2016-24]